MQYVCHAYCSLWKMWRFIGHIKYCMLSTFILLKSKNIKNGGTANYMLFFSYFRNKFTLVRKRLCVWVLSPVLTRVYYAPQYTSIYHLILSAFSIGSNDIWMHQISKTYLKQADWFWLLGYYTLEIQIVDISYGWKVLKLSMF